MKVLSAVAILLSVSTLAGQVPPRDAAPAQSGTGSIRGRVLAADTGSPLRNARIQATGGTGSIPPVFTDSEGHFVVSSLSAGTYRLNAAKPGYVQTSFGSRDGDSTG